MLVGLLCGLVGGFGVLGSVLYFYIKLVEVWVDWGEFVFVGGVVVKVDGGDDCYVECMGEC